MADETRTVTSPHVPDLTPTTPRSRRSPARVDARSPAPAAGGEAGRARWSIHEIYRSLQGESTFAGLPCVFVRLTACHLRCVYCDTPHAFTQGRP